ncbi:MAG: lysozyme family protein [Eubacteriales bacterium]|nr:lysozyme family protein [Eubacteriales bacterium]
MSTRETTRTRRNTAGRAGGSDVDTGTGTGIQDRDSEKLQQERRRQRRELQKQRRAVEVRRQKRMLMIGAVLFIIIAVVGTRVMHRAWAKSKLSDAVLEYQDTVEKYAEREGISEYVDTLLAIMMVESEGRGEDVMQSSESKGLERNSLGPEESIEQACIYFSALIEIAEGLGIHDDRALIQAYNFGPGYLDYVAENGGSHHQKLATAYAKEKSGGEKVYYFHLYAIQKNGGWIYKFGNMFYNAIVQQYL